MNSAFQIRKMTADDIDAVVNIENECFSVPWPRDAFEKMVSASNAIIYVVRCTEDIQCCDADGNFSVVPEGSIAGYAAMYFVRPDISEDGQTIYEGMGDIANVAVTKILRRRGIAKELMNILISDAKKHLLSTLMLEVRQSNESARALYKKMGFIQVGVRKNYYSHPREDAVLMNKHIDILNF